MGNPAEEPVEDPAEDVESDPADGAGADPQPATATSADSNSGISKITFPTPAGMTGGGDDTSSPYAATYSWSGAIAASAKRRIANPTMRKEMISFQTIRAPPSRMRD